VRWRAMFGHECRCGFFDALEIDFVERHFNLRRVAWLDFEPFQPSWRVGGDLTALDKALRGLVSAGRWLHVVYEAGRCGFVIWRHLSRQGLTCEVVVAPSSIARPATERIKTDRRDALLLARLARAGDLAVVRVPDEADEAVRDLVRAREDAVREQRNQKLEGHKSWRVRSCIPTLPARGEVEGHLSPSNNDSYAHKEGTRM